MIAHNGAGFDSFVELNNLLQRRTIVKLIKNGAGNVSLKIFNGYVNENKKTPQYVALRCGRVHTISSLKQTGVSYKLQSSFLKQDMEHNEIIEDMWEAKENEWLRYAKNDVLSTVLCYAKYITGMERSTNFSMKNSLTLQSLANKNFNSLRDENDEAIYTYTDPFMRNYERKIVKGSRCNVFNQHFKSEIRDEVLKIISKELNLNGNICDLLEKYFES